jgi:hypothetical protein
MESAFGGVSVVTVAAWSYRGLRERAHDAN